MYTEPMDPIINSIAIGAVMLVLSTCVAGLVALFTRLRKIEQEQAKLGMQVEPLWSVVQAKMVKDLTHPHVEFHEADDLLAKLDDGTIEPAERARLLQLMEERVTDPNPKIGLEERSTAGAMAFVMKKVEEDEAIPPPTVEVKMVAVKVDTEKPLDPPEL